MKLEDEFIDKQESPHSFPHELGRKIASSLSGFIAGVIFASILWGVGIFLYRMLSGEI